VLSSVVNQIVTRCQLFSFLSVSDRRW